MRNRTLSRRLALQFLYTLHVRGDEAMDDLAEFLLAETDKTEVRAFARRLIEGVFKNLTQIDEHVKRVAHNWRLERMASIDLSIIRLATWELLYTEDIPPIVSINEAIELAKDFSTDKSSAFVNGILDKINLEVGKKGKVGGDAAPAGRQP